MLPGGRIPKRKAANAPSEPQPAAARKSFTRRSPLGKGLPITLTLGVRIGASREESGLGTCVIALQIA